MNYKIISNAIDTNMFHYENLLNLPFQYTYYLDKQNNRVRSPRKMCWFAENASWYYAFSRSHIDPLFPYTFAEYPFLNLIKSEVEHLTQHKFNSCLVNIYENGTEYADWHDDNEPWLGSNPVIASLSFGASRTFEFKEKSSDIIRQITLCNNDLLLMEKYFQDIYQHRLPKDNTNEQRINLTFRKIIPSLTDLQYTEYLKPYWNS